jgi:prepilin peptidase CpaA
MPKHASAMIYFLIAASLVSAIAAVIDWRSGHIPNLLTYSVVPLALAGHATVAWFSGGDGASVLRAMGWSLLGAVLCGMLPFLLWWKGACGGGDVKLFAGLGALLHPSHGMEAQVYAYYVAASFVPIGLLYEGKFLRTLKTSLTIALNIFRSRAKQAPIEPSTHTWFRLGPAIFAGCVWTTALHWP